MLLLGIFSLMFVVGMFGTFITAVVGLFEGNLGSWSSFIPTGGIMYYLTQQPSINIENTLAWTLIPALFAAGWGYKK